MKTNSQERMENDLVKGWQRRASQLFAVSALVFGAMHCGRASQGSPRAGAGAGEAGAGALNDCGGSGRLRFGNDGRLGDDCGECHDGHVACGGPDVLVCLGATAAAPDCSGDADSGTSNACGAFGELLFEGQPASPGASCGACGSGRLICVSPTLLGCYGASNSDCDDAGAGAGVGGAGGSEGSSDAGAGGFIDTTCTGNQYTYQGKQATPGTVCGACNDGRLACGPETSSRLICNGATPSGYCNTPQAAPNQCGGVGPTHWRGIAATPTVKCGPCSMGAYACATKNELTCVSPDLTWGSSCDQSSEDTCTIPSAAFSAPPAHTAPAPLTETKPTVSTFRSMGISINDLVYNPFDRRLYASVPGSDGVNGNSVAVIEPATQTVVAYVPIGSEPQALALSDDGQVLWVMNSGSSTLRRIDLSTLVAGPSLPIYRGFGTLDQRISVLPGTHESVLVRSGVFTVYDDGVPRPLAAASYGTLAVTTHSPQLAFAYDTGNDGLTTFCLDNRGVYAQRIEQQSIGASSSLLFESGVIYGTVAAYDVAKRQIVGSYSRADALAVDPLNRRLFALRNHGPGKLTAYDLDTFVEQGSDNAFPDIQLSAPKLARWGRYGVAFTNGSGFGAHTLFIGRSTLVP